MSSQIETNEATIRRVAFDVNLVFIIRLLALLQGCGDEGGGLGGQCKNKRGWNKNLGSWRAAVTTRPKESNLQVEIASQNSKRWIMAEHPASLLRKIWSLLLHPHLADLQAPPMNFWSTAHFGRKILFNFRFEISFERLASFISHWKKAMIYKEINVSYGSPLIGVKATNNNRKYTLVVVHLSMLRDILVRFTDRESLVHLRLIVVLHMYHLLVYKTIDFVWQYYLPQKI